MWNPPSQKQLEALPKFYSTEKVSSDDKIIRMHFFIGGSDWYIAEYSPEERTFFGFTVMNGDWEMAEWGYTSLDELMSAKQGFVQVDRDLHWTPKKFKEIKRG